MRNCFSLPKSIIRFVFANHRIHKSNITNKNTQALIPFANILVEGTDYNFNIDNTTNSQGEERFSIALKPLSSLLTEDEVLDSVIKIWPNPAVDQFNILNNNSLDVSIQIFTMKGQLIETKKVPSGVTEVIETHGWAAGVYMLKLTNNGTQTIKKLIIE